jgi:hypothetical protein
VIKLSTLMYNFANLVIPPITGWGVKIAQSERDCHPNVFNVGLSGVCLFIVYVFLLCLVTFLVPCCDVRSNFHIKTMFGSSLPPVVCRRVYLCLFTYSGVQHLLCCVFCFVCLCLVCPVFLDCPFGFISRLL